jgi:hypothetical protein
MVIGTFASLALLAVLLYFVMLMTFEALRAVVIRYKMMRIERQARRQPRIYA